ncbi:hypothetical protein IQ249_00045 [Lusitaniella coriacea LEGE 07157]|uniref:Novel STAND NTPase 1 domain-containing protein n=1 Tax=Lusitaniella coriacea LEGE 07157 TaxID=945747 RepID=A0A8J7DTV1_9CYAN|nr:WD40 repeat domain-containing protein [Lusitaniella coriacea]MBE9114276.1 hypothetical protein [Lusitaniella coriacea LEGE 07157]
MDRSSQSGTVAEFNARSLASLSRAILLAQDQFALILVRCNYSVLQEQIWQDIQEVLAPQLDPLRPLKEIHLPKSTKMLFAALLEAVEEEQGQGSAKHASPIAAPIVFGLEVVRNLDRVLTVTNQMRDQFRQHFSFPIVLWVTDEVLQKMTRFAPDFKSWAAVSIKFELASHKSIALWWQTTDLFFRRLLAAGAEQFLPNNDLGLAPGCRDRRELEYARADIHANRATLTPVSEATWQFILGRDAQSDRAVDRAIAHYQTSLEFWQQETGYWDLDINQWAAGIKAPRPYGKAVGSTSSPQSALTNPFLEQKGLLLFHLGWCYCSKAHQEPALRYCHWEQAQRCFGASLEIFSVRQQPNLVAQLTIQLGTILQKLGSWSELETLTLHSLAQSATYNCNNRKARAYGFLAQVALARSHAQEAEFWALKALETQEQARQTVPESQALYRLLLAKAKRQVGASEDAIAQLEGARQLIGQETGIEGSPSVTRRMNWEFALVSEMRFCEIARHPQFNDSEQRTTEKERLYLEISEELRSLYFQQQQYRLAFELKQEQQFIEQFWGLRAFRGTSPLAYPVDHPHALFGRIPRRVPAHQQEIVASGRQKDVQNLIERLRRSECKLTIVHGLSGVGKSSLIHAGLIPALWGQIIGAREVLPIVQTTYIDWEQELNRAFWNAQTRLESRDTPLHTSGDILAQLRCNAQGNVLTILIFDQFEEFFFLHRLPQERQKFYEFLQQCLQLPFVKVILSLREDYLHYLLVMEREMEWGSIDNNLLARQMRYALDDLTCEAASSVIQLLTERSQFHLEKALINCLVKDLAGQAGTVRPIELQVVGAALQAEKITTLEQYQHLGRNPKTVLVERWLRTAIADCGPNNTNAVWHVLFALTDERGTRPLKTKAELDSRYANPREIGSCEKPALEITSPDKIELILDILVGSGLVFHAREDSEDRYRLAHNYLVQPIRQQYNRRTSKALTTQLRSSKVELVRARRQRLQAFAIGGICALFALVSVRLSIQANTQRQRAMQASLNAELLALSSSSEAMSAADKQFDALLEALRALAKMRKVQQTNAVVTADTHLKVVTALEKAVHGIAERNRFEGHEDVVWQVRFAPNGEFLATASRDRAVKLWHPDGRLKATLTGHKESVTSVDVSRDGLIASSSWDGTIRLWQSDGTVRSIIPAHTGQVLCVRFSPNGQTLVSAGEDGSISLWSLEGRLLKTFTSRQGIVHWVDFSPDGQTLASAGDDRTVVLWSVEGQRLRVLRGHQEAVTYIAFNPQGTQIATASADSTIKLWTPQGRLTNTLSDRENVVLSVAFSPDGQTLASAGIDNTVKLWDNQGDLLETFKGHSDRVTSVSFSPDGATLASSSYDKTIELWVRDRTERTVLRGHQDSVRDVAFSPDGQLVATASKDSTIKLWTRDGHLLKTLEGHQDSVYSISFSPDSQRLVSGGKDRAIKLWTRQGQLIKTLRAHQDWVLDLAWTPDGRRWASASRDRTLKIWDRDGTLLETLEGHRDRVNAVSFSADGRLLASTSDDKTIKLWRADPSGQFSTHPAKTLKGHNNWVLDVAFFPNVTAASGLPLSHNKPLLASASYDNTVKLWNYRGEEFKTLKGHTDSVARLSFSPTGAILATTTWDSRLQLWRLDDTLIQTLEEHTDRVTNVSWSQDGKFLATASNDGTAIIWTLDAEQLKQHGCEWLQDYLRYNSRVRESDRALCPF